MRHTCVWHTIMHEVSAHVHEVSAQEVRALEARASLLEGARLTLCTDRVQIVRAQQFHTATVVVNVVAILQKHARTQNPPENSVNHCKHTTWHPCLLGTHLLHHAQEVSLH